MTGAAAPRARGGPTSRRPPARRDAAVRRAADRDDGPCAVEPQAGDARIELADRRVDRACDVSGAPLRQRAHVDELGEEVVRAVGLKTFLVGEHEKTVFELKNVQFDTPYTEPAKPVLAPAEG